MKRNLIVLLLAAGASAFAQAPYGSPGYGPPAGAYDPGAYDPSAGAPTYDSAPPVGSAYGAPGYAAPYADAPTACGPESVWVDGYYDASGFFVNGYCTVPPFAGAYWIGPSYFGGRWVAGYWGHGDARFGFRGGFSTVPRFERGSHFAGGSSRGFQAPAPARSFNSLGGANTFQAPTREFNNFHSQTNARSSGAGMRGGGGFHGAGSDRGRR